MARREALKEVQESKRRCKLAMIRVSDVETDSPDLVHELQHLDDPLSID